MADEQEVVEEAEEVEVEETVWEDLELKCGVTLRLRPVGMPALRKLIEQAGGWSLLKEKRKLAELSDEERHTYEIGSNQLYLYAAGWGVETDPPAVAVEELEALGWTATSKKLIRARWLRYLLMEETEIGKLLGRIIFLSLRGEDSEDKENSGD